MTDNLNKKRNAPNWEADINKMASVFGHVILDITGTPPTRRSRVKWYCTKHPLDGNHYDTRVDCYLNPNSKNKLGRTFCCQAGMLLNRKGEGFKLFCKTLDSRGAHYKTKYTPTITNSEDYKGKHIKHEFKCEAHKRLLKYSLQDLNYNTSCPCPDCRTDPNHKNVCVEIVHKRNAGRAGQVVRHAQKVKNKYNNTCLISLSTWNLHHHHLDGQDFYIETALDWQHNGVCLNATVHRDYHNNFLINYSLIAREYKEIQYNQSDVETLALEGPGCARKNPDFNRNGAEVSRYTFLEYLRFLKHETQKTNSLYIKNLNNKIKNESSLNEKPSSKGTLGVVSLQSINSAIEQYCSEYKGSHWGLCNQPDLIYANNSTLWDKVDNTWVF